MDLPYIIPDPDPNLKTGIRIYTIEEIEMVKSIRANMENQIRMMDKMKWAPVIYEDEE